MEEGAEADTATWVSVGANDGAEHAPESAECHEIPDLSAFDSDAETDAGASDSEPEPIDPIPAEVTNHEGVATPSFSNNRRLSASIDVVRVAPFPEHPSPAIAEVAPHPTPTPPDAPRPRDLDDLFANNPAGVNTWAEVLGGIERIRQYHEVRRGGRP